MNCCKGTKKSAYRRQIFDKNPVHPYLSIIFAPAFTKNPLTVSAFFMQITKGSQKKVVPLQPNNAHPDEQEDRKDSQRN